MRVLGAIVLDRKEQLIYDSKVRKVFARLLTEAGLAQRNLHFLRHTFASLLIQQGKSLGVCEGTDGSLINRHYS